MGSLIVLSPPRDKCGLEMWYEATKIAQENNVNVLIYDPRGSGLSLGRERSTDNGIEDCHAAMQYARKNLCQNDPKKLGLLGYSWGGGVSAAALKKFNPKGEENVGLYINLRSFSVMHKWFESRILQALVKKVIKLMRMDPMHSGKTLAQAKLAEKTVVIKLELDSTIGEQANISDYLQKPNRKTAASEEIEHIWELKKAMIYRDDVRRSDVSHGSTWDYNVIKEKIQDSLKPPQPGSK